MQVLNVPSSPPTRGHSYGTAESSPVLLSGLADALCIVCAAPRLQVTTIMLHTEMQGSLRNCFRPFLQTCVAATSDTWRETADCRVTWEKINKQQKCVLGKVILPGKHFPSFQAQPILTIFNATHTS